MLVLLLLAPFLGETLSTATAPLDLLLPWNLALMIGLYGCGALLVREVVRRFRFGLLGFCLLAAAYGVYEEGLIDRFFFDPKFWHDTGVGDYSVVWHTNLLLATHLTAYHVAVSIGASIAVTEALYPARRQEPWIGRRGLVIAGVVFAVGVPLGSAEFHVPPVRVLIAAGVCCVGLVVAAFLVPRPVVPPGVRRRGAGWIAFGCTAVHFGLVYSVASTGLPWPAGVLLSLLPIVVGLLVIRRPVDALQVVSGILAFFLALDVVIGLGGRYDLTVGAVLAAAGLYRLNRSRTSSRAPSR